MYIKGQAVFNIAFEGNVVTLPYCFTGPVEYSERAFLISKYKMCNIITVNQLFPQKLSFFQIPRKLLDITKAHFYN